MDETQHDAFSAHIRLLYGGPTITPQEIFITAINESRYYVARNILSRALEYVDNGTVFKPGKSTKDWNRGLRLTGVAGAVRARQRTEQSVVIAAVDALLDNGFSVSINNGGEEDEVYHSTDREYIIAHLFQTDEDTIVAGKNGKGFGWIHAVYGNDGWDVLQDYTVNLEPYIGKGTKVDEMIEFAAA